MNRWTAFLNSLASQGGNLFLLYALVVLLIGTDVGLILKYGNTLPAAVEIGSLAKDGFVALIAILNSGGKGSTPTPPIPPEVKA